MLLILENVGITYGDINRGRSLLKNAPDVLIPQGHSKKQVARINTDMQSLSGLQWRLNVHTQYIYMATTLVLQT